MEIKLISDKQDAFVFPPLHIPLLFAAGICGLTFVLYMLYPTLVGEAAVWALGWGNIPLFFANHPTIYALVQGMLRGFYALTTVGILSTAIFFFVYIMLDESVTHSQNRKGLLWLAVQGVIPFILLQFLIGLVGCLLAWKSTSFTALSWLPSFGTASAWQALYTAIWEIACVVFACAFILTQQWQNAFRKAWDLLVSYPVFWLFFAAVLWGLAFVPSWSLQRLGLTASAWYIVSGSFLQLAGLVMGLFMLFYQSGEFEAA